MPGGDGRPDVDAFRAVPEDLSGSSRRRSGVDRFDRSLGDDGSHGVEVRPQDRRQRRIFALRDAIPRHEERTRDGVVVRVDGRIAPSVRDPQSGRSSSAAPGGTAMSATPSRSSTCSASGVSAGTP